MRNYLASFGIESSLTYDARGEKANLYATIGPRDRSGLCLSGHTDVVPADDQPWTVEPFALTRRGDRVLGRGTADMKGFLAAALASVPHFIAQCRQMPIHLAFSYDEETWLPRRARLAQRTGKQAIQAARVRHRRADRHACGGRAQGQAGLSVLR